MKHPAKGKKKQKRGGNSEEGRDRIEIQRKTEEEVNELRRSRRRDSKLYMSRTRKDQPVIKNRIALILKRIEKP